MNTKLSHQAVMFSDVVGSTALYESLGDDQAQGYVSQCLALARASTKSHGGEIVAELGDEVMSVFDDASDATASACEIHVKMNETFSANSPGPILKMRIGIHYGPASEDHENVMSETAKLAHWAASNAKPDQTLGTAGVIEVLPRIYQAVSRFVDDETWNLGPLEHVALHEIIWDIEGVTAYSGEVPTLATQKCKGISFSYRGTQVIVDNNNPVISIGRGLENDLVVFHDLASRQHLTAQFSRGRCTVTDESTNGTVVFIGTDTSNIHSLRRETFALAGKGEIICGEPNEVDKEDAVSFQPI